MPPSCMVQVQEAESVGFRLPVSGGGHWCGAKEGEELITTSGFASSVGGRWQRFCMGDAGGGAFMTLAFRPQE